MKKSSFESLGIIGSMSWSGRLVIVFLVVGLILPPPLVSASFAKPPTPFLPHLSLLLMFSGGKGSMHGNPDITSPVFSYFISTSGIIEFIGQRDVEGNVEKMTGIHIVAEDSSMLFEPRDGNQMEVTFTHETTGPLTFMTDIPVNQDNQDQQKAGVVQEEIAYSVLQPISKAVCYNDPSINPTAPIPPLTKVQGELEVRVCGDLLGPSERNKYSIDIKEGKDPVSQEFFDHKYVQYGDVPNEWKYEFSYPSAEWPFYPGWRRSCRITEFAEGLILELAQDVAVFLLSGPAVAAKIAKAAAKANIKLSVDTVTKALERIRQGWNVFDTGKDLVGMFLPKTCKDMKADGDLKCIEGGAYAEDEKALWQNSVLYNLSIQESGNPDREAEFSGVHFLNTNNYLFDYKADFGAPTENGTAIPAGTYTGSGKHQYPWDCDASISITVNQDGNITRFRSEYCEKAGSGYSALPYTWEVTPDFGPPENHKITVTSYGLPAQTGLRGVIESECDSQYQATIAPSGRPGTEMRFSYDRNSGILSVVWGDFANTFSGEAR